MISFCFYFAFFFIWRSIFCVAFWCSFYGQAKLVTPARISPIPDVLLMVTLFYFTVRNAAMTNCSGPQCR